MTRPRAPSTHPCVGKVLTVAGRRSRRPSLANVVKAMTKAGVKIARVEIDKAGKIVIIALGDEPASEDEKPENLTDRL